MKKLGKGIVLLMCCVCMLAAFVVSASAQQTVTIYSPSGDCINVVPSEVAIYAQWGWSSNIDDVRTILYSPSGSAYVYNAQVDSYLAVGWSRTPTKIDYVTPLPVTFLESTSWSTDTYDLTKFDVTKIEYTSSGKIRINYDLKYNVSGYMSLYVYCYDANGVKVGEQIFNEYMRCMDVPGNTATFTIEPQKSSYSTVSGKFEYRRQIDMYSLDGRSITVYDLQAPVYESVGWLREIPQTTMYAPGNRTVNVASWEVENYKTVGWYTEPFITLYSLDGRMIEVLNSQVEAYKAVGWYDYIPQITMYAPGNQTVSVPYWEAESYKAVGWYTEPLVILYSLDGRTVEVPSYDVEAYKAVGWYTYDGFCYMKVKINYDSYVYAAQYENAISLIEDNEDDFKGTEYEYQLQVLKAQAMDLWRNSIRCPLAIVGSSTGESYGVPYARITFRNVSYKKIAAFKLVFTCYNIFGNVEETYYDYYYDDDANLDSGEGYWATWDLYGADSVHHISNIRITEVVYIDGTKW